MNRTSQAEDVALTKMTSARSLDRVGMSKIECPVVLESTDIKRHIAPAKCDAFVSLDEPQKGIHMSRLFLSLTEKLPQFPLSPKLLADISHDFLVSHKGISLNAHVKVSFELMLQRKSLVSQNVGWRSYPVSLWATSGTHQSLGVDLEIMYSSTCPCSAALARQLIQNKFSEQFPPAHDLTRDEVLTWLGREEAIAGTPHGQRSLGTVRLMLASPVDQLDFVVTVIDALESALATPVQSAVKREDEQEFARLNATNLMFAEDAARRMSDAVANNPQFIGTACEVKHLESLHPHDAVAKIATGTLRNVSWL